MSAYKKQKYTFWRSNILAPCSKENRLIFFSGAAGAEAGHGESRNLGTSFGETETTREALKRKEQGREQVETTARDARATEAEEAAKPLTESNEYKEKTIEEKIAQSGLENGRVNPDTGKVSFTVAGVERSFRMSSKNRIFQEAIANAETPEEVKYICYKTLLAIIGYSTDVKKLGLKSTKHAINNSNLEMINAVAAHEGKPKITAETNKPTANDEASEEKTTLAQDLAKFLGESKVITTKNDTITVKSKWDRLSTPIEITKNIITYRLDPDNAPRVKEIPKDSTAKDIAELIDDIDTEKNDAINEYSKYAKNNIDTSKFEIKNYDNYFQIKDDVAGFIESEDFSKNFHRLSNAHLYEEVLTQHFGVKSQELAPKVLQAIVTEGYNDRVYFPDLINITKSNGGDGAKFKADFEALLKKVNSPTEYKNKEADRQKLKAMYDVYLDGQKLLRALANEKIKDKKTVAPSDALDSTFQQLREVELKKHGSYYNFDEMADNKFPTKNTGKVRIGLTMNAINKFKTVYKQTTGQEFGDRTPEKILTALMRAHTKEELIGRENVIAKVKNAPNNNATYLIIEDLPASFTANKLTQEICLNINNASLAKPKESSLGWDVDEKTPEQEHQQKVEKLKSKLSSDEDQYHKQLLNLFKKAEKEDRKGQIDHAFSDAAELGTEDTRDKESFYRHTTLESATISAEAMADQLLNKQFATIKENGKETKLQLYYIKNGQKVINDRDVLTYFNYLIKKGYEQKQQDKNIEDGIDDKDSRLFKQKESDAKFEQFYKLDPNKTLLDQVMLPDQVQALRAGYVAELQADAIRQQAEIEQQKINYSPNPGFAKIQKEALETGYPKYEIEQIPAKIIAAVGAETKGKSLESIGAGIAIPIGHDFYINFGVSNNGVGAGIGATTTLYKSKSSEVGAGGGAGVMFDGKELTPAIPIGFFAKTQLGDTNVDIGAGVGVMLSTKKSAIVVMPYLSENEDRETQNIVEKTLKRFDFDEVEKAPDTKSKAALLRKNARYSDVQQNLDDADLVATYERHKSIIIAKAMKESDGYLFQPYVPISTIGVGLALGYDAEKGEWSAGLALGVEIKIGEDIVYKPYRGERERLAKSLSEQQINKVLEEQISASKIETGKVRFQKIDTEDLYINSNGEIAIKDNGSSAEAKTDPSNFESLASLLGKVNIGARKANLTLKPGEAPKTSLELTIQDTAHKDMEVYIDSAAKKLGVVVNEKTGQIYIPGNNDNLLITRERFNYPARRTEGGAAITDIIIITTKEKLDRNRVISQASTVLENRWENGKASGWEISNGAKTRGENKIHSLSEYQSGARKWDFENYSETVYGMDKGEYESIHKIAKGNRTPKDSYDKQEIPTGWEDTCRDLYKKMAVDLDNGKPQIDDFRSILRRVKAENPQLAAMNDKMASELLTTFQHEYFINLWSRKGREGIIKLHKTNSEGVRKYVLLPIFKEKIVKLGLAPAGQEDSYADMLTTKIQELESANFIANLNKLGNPPDLSKLSEVVRGIDGHMLMYSGTLVRSNKHGLLTGGPKQYNNETTTTRTMGTFGDTTKWDINSPDKSTRDIAKIILDVSSPSLSLEDRKSLKGPLAVQLKAFEGTGIAIGAKNFKLASEFLNNPDQEIVAGSETETALKAFIEFAKQVRNTAINGKEIEVEVDGEKKPYRILNLKQGASILIPKPEAESGSYGECSNISLLAGESFILITKVGGKIRVAGANTNIHNQINLSEDRVKLVLGLIAKPGEEHKPTERGGKDQTEVTHDTPNTDDKTIKNTTIVTSDGTERQIGGASSVDGV